MRSLPPFALHLQYAPRSEPSCGITPPLPCEGKLARTPLPRYMPVVGPSDRSAVNPGMFISTSCLLSSMVVVRRNLCHQERELFGHIDACEELLDHIRLPVGERKDHVHDPARAAERRRTHVDRRQRAVSREG